LSTAGRGRREDEHREKQWECFSHCQFGLCCAGSARLQRRPNLR
jgi:hypothetical protein